MGYIDSVKYHIDDINYEVTRSADCKGVFIYKRGNNLPQFFTLNEATAFCAQISTMVNRSEFYWASKGWSEPPKKKD